MASGIPMPGSLYSDSRPWPTTSAFPALLVVPCVGPFGTLGTRWGRAALPMSDRESRAGALTGYRRGVNAGIPAARPAVMSGRLECRPAGAPQDGRSPAAGVSALHRRPARSRRLGLARRLYESSPTTRAGKGARSCMPSPLPATPARFGFIGVSAYGQSACG